jgi:type I restriction enzyme S subunit
MKDRWPLTKLGDLCQTSSGGTPLRDRKEYYENGTIPWLLSGEVSQGEIRSATNFITRKGMEQSAAKLFPKNTVLVAMYGATAGQVGILRFEATTNQAICGIFPSKHFLPEFLFYAVLSRKDELIAKATGNAQPNISQIKIRNTSIPVPPIPEQQRIVGILDEAFDAIAKAKTNAEKNLQSARALFESYLESVFSERGEGWRETLLGTIATFRNGLNFTQQSKGERVKIVGVKDFQSNFWVPLRNLETVTIDGILPKTDLLKRGDILSVRSNGNIELIGRCILADEVQENIAHSGFTIRIRLQSDELLPEYLCHFMKYTGSRRRLVEGGTGTNIKSLNQQALSALVVPFPPRPKQSTIVDAVREMSTETQHLASIYRRKLTALDELKKSLLHQAFTGTL